MSQRSMYAKQDSKLETGSGVALASQCHPLREVSGS